MTFFPHSDHPLNSIPNIFYYIWDQIFLLSWLVERASRDYTYFLLFQNVGSLILRELLFGVDSPNSKNYTWHDVIFQIQYMKWRHCCLFAINDPQIQRPYEISSACHGELSRCYGYYVFQFLITGSLSRIKKKILVHNPIPKVTCDRYYEFICKQICSAAKYNVSLALVSIDRVESVDAYIRAYLCAH